MRILQQGPVRGDDEAQMDNLISPVEILESVPENQRELWPDIALKDVEALEVSSRENNTRRWLMIPSRWWARKPG